jgi:hypothetical protein
VLTLEAVDDQGKIFNERAVVSNLTVNSAYRWDLFHAALRGRAPAETNTPEQLVAGVRVIRAMTQALANGGTWRQAR